MKNALSPVGMTSAHPAYATCIFLLAGAMTLGLFLLFASALIALPTGSLP
jgi:HAMP domain-containing protein